MRVDGSCACSVGRVAAGEYWRGGGGTASRPPHPQPLPKAAVPPVGSGQLAVTSAAVSQQYQGRWVHCWGQAWRRGARLGRGHGIHPPQLRTHLHVGRPSQHRPNPAPEHTCLQVGRVPCLGWRLAPSPLAVHPPAQPEPTHFPTHPPTQPEATHLCLQVEAKMRAEGKTSGGHAHEGHHQRGELRWVGRGGWIPEVGRSGPRGGEVGGWWVGRGGVPTVGPLPPPSH